MLKYMGSTLFFGALIETILKPHYSVFLKGVGRWHGGLLKSFEGYFQVGPLPFFARFTCIFLTIFISIFG